MGQKDKSLDNLAKAIWRPGEFRDGFILQGLRNYRQY
jgi:hypothetical protein